MGREINLPNMLSILRGPLALAFLWYSPVIRAVAIALAMLSDYFDGFFARRWRQTTQFGAVLDPAMDEFFVIFVSAIFFMEDSIQLWQIAALLCRDFAVLLFGAYLYFAGAWTKYRFRAIWCGKVTTTLQFFVFFALSFHYPVPDYVFPAFALLGCFALIELYFMARHRKELT